MLRRLRGHAVLASLATFVALAMICAISVHVADAARGQPTGNVAASRPVPLPGPSGPVNHLTNPSFDADADFDNVPDGWWLKPGVLTETYYYLSSPWAINGHVSGFTGIILSQDLDVTVPGSAVVSASAYIAKTFAPGNNQLGFSINYRDSGGNVYTAEIMRPSVILTDGTFSEFTGTLTLPTTATKVTRFFVTRNESGQYYLDSLALNIDPYVPVWKAVMQAPGYPGPSYDGLAAYGSNKVWVGGGYDYMSGGGRVLHSADGGASWVTQTLPNTSSSVVAIDFGDADNGWALGSINRTINGGSTWITQSIPASGLSLVDIDAVDASNAWVVGYDLNSNGVVLRTGDGGTTWISQTFLAGIDLTGLDFLDANNGWIVGYAYSSYSVPYIFHTSNGGTTWITQTLPITNGGLSGVRFLDANNGWAVGEAYTAYGEVGLILHTTNGGTTWTLQPSGNTGWFNTIAFADAFHGCATGHGLYCTSDGGVTWHTTPPTVAAGYMFMLNDITYSGGVGWAVGMPGVVLRYGVPAGAGSIVGSARLQGRSNHSGVLVSANPTATTVANGAFTVTNLSTGFYNVSASMAGYLTSTVRNVPVSEPQTTVLSQLLLLRGGDAVRDGVVDIYDLVAVGGNFGTASAVADINGDGTVNIFDIVMVGANYGRSSESRDYAP